MTDPAEPLEEEFATVRKALATGPYRRVVGDFQALDTIQAEHRRLAALVSFIEERNPSVSLRREIRVDRVPLGSGQELLAFIERELEGARRALTPQEGSD